MRHLCLNFILNHPPSFVNFFGPKATGEYIRVRPYQATVFLSSKRAALRGGRRWGKTFFFIWMGLIRAITKPNKSQLLTTLRRTHVQNVFEPIVDIMNNVRFFGYFYKTGREYQSVRRDIVKTIDFINGHQYVAISVGDDPKAAQIKGQSPSVKYIDEAQDYPDKAAEILSSSEDPSGCEEYWAGVVDGRRDTPFYSTLEKSNVFKNDIYKFSRRYDPHFNQYNLEKAREQLGDDSNRFAQEIDAEHGDVESGAWNMADILDSVEGYDNDGRKTLRMKVFTLTPRNYRRGADPSTVLRGLNGGAHETIIAVDVGEVQPTVIIPFEYQDNIWRAKIRVEMKERVDTYSQLEVLKYVIGVYTNVRAIAIDCTSSPAIADMLEAEDPDLQSRIIRVKFNSSYPYETLYVDDKEKQELIFKETGRKPRIGAEIKRTMPVKNFCTQEGIKMLARGEVVFYYDPIIVEEFSAETIKNGKIRTPPDIHIPEVFRCFIMGWHRTLDDETDVDIYSEFFPEPAATGYFGRAVERIA